MKTSKVIKLLVEKESLSSHFGLDWLNGQIGRFVIERFTYDDFFVFDLPDTKKIRFLLADMIFHLSLTIDVYHEVNIMALMIRDLSQALRR